MKIETLYYWGQPLWYVWEWRKEVKVECAACGGSGKVRLLDMNEHSCPACNGNGYMSIQGSWEASVELATIVEVVVKQRRKWGDDNSMEEFAEYRVEYPTSKTPNHGSPLTEGKVGELFFKTEGEARRKLSEHPGSSVKVEKQ